MDQINEIQIEVPSNETVTFQGKKVDIPDMSPVVEVTQAAEQPAEPPKVAVPDSPERRKFVHRLEVQKRHFPDCYKSVLEKYDKLKYIPTEELEGVCEEIQQSISSRNSISIVKGGVLITTNVVENVGPLAGYDLKGLTNMVNNPNNKEMSDVIKELECKYCFGYNGMGPEVKFLFHLGLAAYQVDAHNRAEKEKVKMTKRNLSICKCHWQMPKLPKLPNG